MRIPIHPILASAIFSCLLTSCRGIGKVTDATLLLPDTFTYNRQWQRATWIIGTDTLAVEARGRGHSTFRQPKHPYAIRTDKASSVAGLPARRHWVLLANFFDHSLMRNALAMEIAQQTSLADVTPPGRFVSLRTQEGPQGLYWLSERVKDQVGKQDSLLQLDVYHQQEQRVNGLPLDTLPGRARMDTLSLIDWWLIHEMCMNAEPCGPRSCYFRLTPDSTLKAGPIWDFDMAFNEVGIDNGGDLRPTRFRNARALPPFLQGKTIYWLTADSLYCFHSPIMRTWLSAPRFLTLAARRWKQLRPKFKRASRHIRSLSRAIRSHALEDQQRWNALEPARFDASTTWTESVRRLRRTCRRRLKALDGKLTNFAK